MTLAGWLFLIVSLSAVWGLAGWCYWKILSDPGPDEPTRG